MIQCSGHTPNCYPRGCEEPVNSGRAERAAASFANTVALLEASVCRVLIVALVLAAALVAPASAGTVKVAETGAVVCSLLSDEQIAYTYVRENKQDRLKNLKSCWYVPAGMEVIGLAIAGQFAWIAHDQGIVSKGWTSVQWLLP